MADIVLTTRQRNALFALMAEASEVSNVELRDKYGVTLNGQERERLNELRLVQSRRVGRTYHHELSDSGWARCREELGAPRSPRGNVALYAVLIGLDRYCQRTNTTLADIFGGGISGSTTTAIDDAIRDAYKRLARRPTSLVSLTALRGQLSQFNARTVNQALQRLAGIGAITLAPQEDQKRLTQTDRAAAVRFGGRDMHMVSMAAS